MDQRIFISAGEASGDLIGAALVDEIRRLHKPKFEQEPSDSRDVAELIMRFEDELGIEVPEEDAAQIRSWSDARDYLVRRGISPDRIQFPRASKLQIQGITGPKLRQAGVHSVADSSRWGSVGIVQALKVVPSAIRGLKKAKEALANGKPGLLIAIDFGYFNIRLARYAKERGWKVLYFMPPGSWRRDKQGADLPSVADEIVTPFPWSADILRGMGASVHWFGHPLKQVIASSELGSRNSELIGVLPGSRKHELELNLPLIAQALGDLPMPAEFALAPSLSAEDVRARWARLAPARTGDLFTQGDTYGVLGRARAAIVCSGTATLEAALIGCPMVVVYRVTRGMDLQAKIAGFRPEYVGLPNILLERAAIPEAVGVNATPETVRRALEPLLSDTPERKAQLEAFEEIQALTGGTDAITRTAELALALSLSVKR